jgi:hypothetical protein
MPDNSISSHACHPASKLVEQIPRRVAASHYLREPVRSTIIDSWLFKEHYGADLTEEASMFFDKPGATAERMNLHWSPNAVVPKHFRAAV